MLFAITTVLATRTAEGDNATMLAHSAYLQQHADRILAAGPTVRGDGTRLGSICLFEADTLLAAVQFVEDDPMTTSGLQASVEIVEWQMAGFNRVYPLGQQEKS